MVTRKFGGNVKCKFQTLDGLCLCKEACKETHMEKKMCKTFGLKTWGPMTTFEL